MQLNDATLEIRPRSAWEAIDLGALLARRHARLLMLSWALLTLPVFALLSLLFWSHPSLALLLFWWLKPLYERLHYSFSLARCSATHRRCRKASGRCQACCGANGSQACPGDASA